MGLPRGITSGTFNPLRNGTLERTLRLLRKMGVKKIQMMAGKMSKTFHLVFFSSHRKNTGNIVMTIITPMRSVKIGSEFIRSPRQIGKCKIHLGARLLPASDR